jgi:hypothetical protein
MMTYAQAMLKEGMDKGIQQGALAGRRAVLARQLSRKHDLSDHERRRIEACDDPDALDAALDEVVVAETKDAVLAKLPPVTAAQ